MCFFCMLDRLQCKKNVYTVLKCSKVFESILKYSKVVLKYSKVILKYSKAILKLF